MTGVRADVLVIGAGPAGSAAAATLAAGGARVVLADRAHFPRDKVCGDGLLPDALAALGRLGIADAARREGHAVTAMLLYEARRGGAVRVPLDGVVWRRERLDALLVERAAAAGAEVLAGATLAGLEGDGGDLTAARLYTSTGEVVVTAPAFVLATGAAHRPRELAGLAGGGPRAAVAMRGYARLAGPREDEMVVALRPDLPGGYAWAFAAGGGVWNVGCGLTRGERGGGSLARAAERTLRELGGGEWSAPPRGAPLFTGFPRAPFAAGNLVAVGDAAGLTRPLSGEGIGPALDSGIEAGHCLLGGDPKAAVAAYRQRMLARYRGDFRAWRFGEAFLGFPRLGAALVARAQHPGARRRLAALLAGTVAAERVLSPWALVMLLVRR